MLADLFLIIAVLGGKEGHLKSQYKLVAQLKLQSFSSAFWGANLCFLVSVEGGGLRMKCRLWRSIACG